MAKLFKMLNLQNSIILIVLLAATVVNSTKPETSSGSSGSSSEITENDIQIYVDRLEYYRNTTGGREDAINHFHSWQYWNGTSRAFKQNCVNEHRNQLNANTGPGDLGQLAFRALDKLIREDVKYGLGLELVRGPREAYGSNEAHERAGLIEMLDGYFAQYP